MTSIKKEEHMRRVEKILLVLGGIVIGACATEAVSTAVRTAHAQAGPRCDYSQIVDSGMPELGHAGAISYDSDWQAMVAGGWRLKAVHAPSYVFERCTPPSP